LKVIRFSVGVLAGALLLGIPTQNLFADVINWATWTSQAGVDPGCQTPATVNGSASTVSIQYTGDTCGFVSNATNWTPATSYVDGTIVANAPPASGDVIKLYGGTSDENTITFSTPVINPVMAIWSLGSDTTSAAFDFNQTPTFVAGGPSTELGGTALTVNGDTVSGMQANGTIEFKGTFNSISWTNPTLENYYGFTVGFAEVAPVPEPASFLLLGTGLVGLWMVRRRKTA
jgi:hypothetical protein